MRSRNIENSIRKSYPVEFAGLPNRLRRCSAQREDRPGEVPFFIFRKLATRRYGLKRIGRSELIGGNLNGQSGGIEGCSRRNLSRQPSSTEAEPDWLRASTPLLIRPFRMKALARSPLEAGRRGLLLGARRSSRAFWIAVRIAASISAQSLAISFLHKAIAGSALVLARISVGRRWRRMR